MLCVCCLKAGHQILPPRAIHKLLTPDSMNPLHHQRRRALHLRMAGGTSAPAPTAPSARLRSDSEILPCVIIVKLDHLDEVHALFIY